MTQVARNDGAPGGAQPDGLRAEARRRRLTTAAFLAPAAFFLIIWLVYPTVATVWRSLFDRSGDEFVWLSNYKAIFTTDTLVKALQNNVLWVAVVPALVTAIGLVLAVLTERIRWQVAFRLALFMPMAISLFAAGVIWRIMDEKDPSQGTLNASIGAVRDALGGSGSVLPNAVPSTEGLTGSLQTGFYVKAPVQAGGQALIGLTGIAPTALPASAKQAAAPAAAPGTITGVVWRDFKPGGGTPGQVEPEELGVPGATVELRKSGSTAAIQTAKTDDAGAFTFKDVGSGDFTVGASKDSFGPPYAGVSWLGSKLINPAVMIAYIWVWAGFAMVIIAAGLAAISREVLEAARTDGATEWQVFRRVTAPMLAPVLSVVFITMLINVLKVFDIVLSVAPASSQDDANVIALAMWRTSFGGVNDFGLGSAIAVLLLVLVLPALALNVRRFKREQ
ncbi:MAG: ABC transporter permease subunit [Solirubrobacteraceae bacterium]|nr:ABC transporter permease subunit [Solirubrobacteraceae bacterium]